MASGPDAPTGVTRFDTNERTLHWVNAAGFFVLLGSGALLFVPALGDLVGRRDVVRAVHDVAGVTVVVWALVAVCGRWGRALRRDLGRIDVFDEADRSWLRGGWRGDLFGSGARDPAPAKFNAGQKINAVATAAATAVLAGTGTVMLLHTEFPRWLKAGANLVHVVVAAALTVLVAAHIVLALRDPGAMRGILTGRVSRSWIRRHHGGWGPERL